MVWLVALAGVGTVAVVGIVAAQRAGDEATGRWGPLRAANDRLLTSMLDAETGERGFLITGKDQFLEPYRRARSSFSETVDQARDLAGGDGLVRSGIEDQSEVFHAWVDTFGEPILAIRRRDAQEAEAMAAGGRGLRLVEEFRELNAATETLVVDRRRASIARARAMAVATAALTVVTCLAGVAAASRLARRLRAELVRPLEEVQATLTRLQAGEPGARTEPSGVAEVWAVAHALNTMADENERLAGLQRERLEREQAIRSAAGAVRASLERSMVLAAATQAIGQAVGADRVALWSFGSGAEEGKRLASWNAPEAAGYPESVTRAPPEIVEWTTPDLVAGRLVVVSDVDTAERLSVEARRWLGDLGLGAVVVAPVLSGSRVLAAATVEVLGAPRSWTDGELSVVEAVCRELAAALGQALVYDQERQLVVRLKELDQAKSDFVSSVSHELRTPLTSIMGYAEMLRDGEAGELTGEQDGMLAVVERNTERLLALIEDLLTLSRIESGAFRVTLSPVDVGEVVRRAVPAFAPEVAERRIDLGVDVDADLPRVAGDAFQLERVVLNLVSNAVKFTPECGQVRVAVRAVSDGTGAELVVSDTGIGIPVEEQGRLFTRFYRSSTAKGIRGTGLGLAIVKGVVENHAGTITVDSQPGRGTTFVVRLPAADRTPTEVSGR